MSYRYTLKSQKFIELVLNKIKKANELINDYKRTGNITALPANAFINYAGSMYLKGYVQEAEDLLKNATNFPNTGANAYINLGVIKQSSGKFKDALKYYLQAYKKDNNNSKVLCLWGNCLALMGDSENAILKYKHASEINDKDSEVYLSWGALLLKNKKYEEAKEKLELSYKYNITDFRALYMLSVIDIENSDFDSALAKLLIIINSTVNNFEAFHNIAYVYFKKKDYDNAIKYALKTLSIFKYKIETYLLLGDIFALKNMEQDSLRFYEDAEKLNLKTFFLYMSWGTTLQKFLKYDEAIEKFEKAKEYLNNTQSPALYSKLALSYLKTNNIELASEYNSKALNIDENDYLANSIEAEIQMEKCNFEQAINYALKCEDDFENKGYNYTIIAVCYKKLKDYSNSEKYFEKALEYSHDDEEILLEYGTFLNETQNYELLKKRFKRYEDKTNNIEFLKLYFIAQYNLAKQNGYKYNIKGAIDTANKIETLNKDSFPYIKEKQELESLINNSE